LETKRKIEALSLEKDMLNSTESPTEGFKSTVAAEGRAMRKASFKVARAVEDSVLALGMCIGTRAIMELLSVPRLFGTETLPIRTLVMDRIAD
jgi:hypothetical protein